MRVDTGLTRTHKDARSRKNRLRQVPLLLRQFLLSLLFLETAFLHDGYLKEKVNIPARHHQTTQDLQARNRLLESPLMILRRVSGLKGVCRNQRDQPHLC